MKKMVMYGLLYMQLMTANKDYELFLQGNQACKQGQYKEALSAYNGIQSGSCAIAYNKGCAYYGLGDYPEALAAFYQAQLNASGDFFSKVNHAIECTQDKLQLPHNSWLYKFLVWLQRGVIWLGMWQKLLLIWLVLLPYLYIFRRQWFLSPWRFLVCIPFLIGVELVAYYYVHQPCMVVVKEASVYAGPNNEFDTVGLLLVGQRVKLVDENAAWCKMQYHNLQGWVQKGDVRVIKDYLQK